MGTERTKSEQRRAARLRLGEGDRPTLLPCPSCDGQGKFVWEDKGRYRGRDCKWCFASGTVDFYVMKLFTRWLRLRNVNRARCGTENKFPPNK